MWRQKIQLDQLSHIIAKINDSNARDNSVDCCSDLFDALNKCWQQFSSISHSSKDLSDIKSLTNLIMEGLSEEQKIQIAQSIELSNLALLEPKVMNHNTLNKKAYDPSNISDKIRREAQDEHRQLYNAYSRFKNDSKEESIEPLFKKTSQLLYVIRSNIKHGEKTPKGPDLNRSERDRTVCKVVKPLLNLFFETLFDCPRKRLAVYGTLIPGGINHQIIADLPGNWFDGKVEGKLEEINKFQVFTWVIDSYFVDVKILESDLLPQGYKRLDVFEGELYKRIWIPIRIDERIVVGNIYAGNKKYSHDDQ